MVSLPDIHIKTKIPDKELNIEIINEGVRLQHIPTDICAFVNNPLMEQALKEYYCRLIICSRINQLNIQEKTFIGEKSIFWDFRKGFLPKITFKNNFDSSIKNKILNQLTNFRLNGYIEQDCEDYRPPLPE